MSEPQCWWNCRYAAGISRGWYVPSKMIINDDIYDSYCCENSNVLNIDAFYKENASTPPENCSRIPIEKKLAQLAHIENADEIFQKKQEIVALTRATLKTNVCRVCKFHEYK